MWHSARASTGSDRSRLQPPSVVSVASQRAAAARRRRSRPRHVAWNACRLPVMVMSWVRFSRSRTGRPVSVAPSAAIAAKPVRLHLLAAEAAAHPQALHGDLRGWQPEHVGDDLLGLGRVLGAATARRPGRSRRPAPARRGSRGRSAPGPPNSGSPLNTCAAPASAGLDVAAARRCGWRALEALGRDRLAQRDQRRAAARSRPRPPPRPAGPPRGSRRAPSRRRGRRTSPRRGTAARRA